MRGSGLLRRRILCEAILWSRYCGRGALGRYADPEESEVFEIGAKIKLPTGYLNIAVFDQKIEGFQSNTFVGTGFILANAGSQSTEGYEFDLVMSPTESIDLAISGLFMDPIYDSFPNSSAGDLTGTMPSNV